MSQRHDLGSGVQERTPPGSFLKFGSLKMHFCILGQTTSTMDVLQKMGEQVAAVDLGAAVTVLPDATTTVVDASPNHMN